MTLFAGLCAAVAAYLLVHVVARWDAPRVRKRTKPTDPTKLSLETRLRQAGLGISASRYRAAIVGAVVLTFLVAYAVTSTASVSIVPAITVAMLPRTFYRRRRDKILAERVGAWPEAIRDVLTHLAVDNTLHRALVQLGRTGPAALRPVWDTYRRNAAVLDVPAALAQVRAELADPVSDHVIEALEAAHERGNQVATEVLKVVAEQVSRDVQLREEIITSQAEIRAQAVFAVVLPFAMLALLVSANEAFARFYARPIGWIVIGFGAGLASIGWKLINTLGKIPTDPRILTRRGHAS